MYPMNRFKKILALITLIAALLTLLCSCERDRKYDETEVITAAKELISKSHKLNELLYGEGLAFTDEGIGVYKRASAESLAYYGIETVDDIKAMVKEIFSESYSEIIFASDIFTGVKIGDEIKSYARYYQSYDENDKPNGIMVRSDYNYPLRGSYEYHDSMEVIDVEGDIIVVNTLVFATSVSGTEKNVNFKVRLEEDTAGWRLVSPTYVVYNEYTDLYDDLINNK